MCNPNIGPIVNKEQTISSTRLEEYMTGRIQSSFDFGQPFDEMPGHFQVIDLPDAEIVLFPHFISSEEWQALYSDLESEINWKHKTIKVYASRVNLPRLTSWHGVPGARYAYSGIENEPSPWTSRLTDIKHRVQFACLSEFNSVLLNFYRSGSDSVAWHRDNEPELGNKPVIASVSLGAERVFQVRHRDKNVYGKRDILLTSGSLLVMRGTTQQFWEHQIPKTAKPVTGRINLTFRNIMI